MFAFLKLESLTAFHQPDTVVMPIRSIRPPFSNSSNASHSFVTIERALSSSRFQMRMFVGKNFAMMLNSLSSVTFVRHDGAIPNAERCLFKISVIIYDSILGWLIDVLITDA